MNIISSLIIGSLFYCLSQDYLSFLNSIPLIRDIVLYASSSIVGFISYKVNYDNKMTIGSISWFMLKLFAVQSLFLGLVRVVGDYIGFNLNFVLIQYSFFILALCILFLGFKKTFKSIFRVFVFSLNMILVNIFRKSPFKFKIDKENINLDYIDNLGNNGRDFEDFISALYREAGFKSKTTTDLKNENNLPDSVMKTAGNGEQGVDVIVFFDTLQVIDGQEYSGLLIQCKHYKNTVGNKAIQEIYTAVPMYSQHFGLKFKPIVYTNNFFTKPAKNLAESTGVGLIDRDTLPLVLNEIAQAKQVA